MERRNPIEYGIYKNILARKKVNPQCDPPSFLFLLRLDLVGILLIVENIEK